MCITSFPSSLKQDPFDWDQYAEDLSQCVEAMIATAILEDSLAECKTKQETIAVNEGYLLEQFDKIDDAPDLNIIIAEIASIIDVITDKMGKTLSQSYQAAKCSCV